MQHIGLHDGRCVDTETDLQFHSRRRARRLAAAANMLSNASAEILRSQNATRSRGNGLVHISRPPSLVFRAAVRAGMQDNRPLQGSEVDLWVQSQRRERRIMAAASALANGAMSELNHTSSFPTHSGHIGRSPAPGRSATPDLQTDLRIQSRRDRRVRAAASVLAESIHSVPSPNERRQEDTDPHRSSLRPQNSPSPPLRVESAGAILGQYRERRQDRRSVRREGELPDQEEHWDASNALNVHDGSEVINSEPIRSSSIRGLSGMDSAPSATVNSEVNRIPTVARDRWLRPDEFFAKWNARHSTGLDTQYQQSQTTASPSFGNALLHRRDTVATLPAYEAGTEGLLDDDDEFEPSEPPPEYSLEDLHLEQLRLSAL